MRELALGGRRVARRRREVETPSLLAKQQQKNSLDLPEFLYEPLNTQNTAKPKLQKTTTYVATAKLAPHSRADVALSLREGGSCSETGTGPGDAESALGDRRSRL